MKLRLLLCIFVSCILFGCKSQQHTTDSMQVFSKVETKTEYVFDTVYYSLPQIVKEVTTKDTLSVLDTKFATSSARVTDGLLFHSLTVKDTPIPVEVRHEIVTNDSIVYIDREIKRTIEVKKPLSSLQKFSIAGFWVLAAVVVVFLFRWIKRRFA